MSNRFIKVTKANKNRDRGFIAVDAICSVFEDTENHNVSIMTMDGFWYEVEDDIEKLYSLVDATDATISSSKKEYLRKKKMMSAMVANDKVQKNHEDRKGSPSFSEKDSEKVVKDYYTPELKKPRGKKVIPSGNRILPAGAGEGCNEKAMKLVTPSTSLTS